MIVTHYITGPADTSEAEFLEHYVPQIQKALREPDCEFVIAARPGFDQIARRWLIRNGVAPQRITIHTTNHLLSSAINGCNILSIYVSHAWCVDAMASASNYIITHGPELDTLRHLLRPAVRFWTNDITTHDECSWDQCGHTGECHVLNERCSPGEVATSPVCKNCITTNFGR